MERKDFKYYKEWIRYCLSELRGRMPRQALALKLEVGVYRLNAFGKGRDNLTYSEMRRIENKYKEMVGEER